VGSKEMNRPVASEDDPVAVGRAGMDRAAGWWHELLVGVACLSAVAGGATLHVMMRCGSARWRMESVVRTKLRLDL
jgi:hypothetical protein